MTSLDLLLDAAWDYGNVKVSWDPDKCWVRLTFGEPNRRQHTEPGNSLEEAARKLLQSEFLCEPQTG